jgi:putative DNA methylase
MGIPIDCKRLIEVDFPLVSVSNNSSKEKNVKVGRITSVHVWFARRPLSACRAMNLACMLPDPDDENCLPEHRDVINQKIKQFYNDPEKIFDSSSEISKNTSLRNKLLGFIDLFSVHKNRNNTRMLKCVHDIMSGIWGSEKPIMLDSFAGGGSIPLEGQLIGMKSIASDINPIPVLLNKLQLELLPNLEESHFDEILSVAKKINFEVQEELIEAYPANNSKRPSEFVPIGYLCSRSIICEGIGCGVSYPLLASRWIAKRKKLGYDLTQIEDNKVKVRIINNPSKTEGNVSRHNATCPICEYTTPSKSVKRQMLGRNGGTEDSVLLAVVCKSTNKKGRFYFEPNQEDLRDREKAHHLCQEMKSMPEYANIIPNNMMKGNSRYLTPPFFGMNKWSDAYTPRQLISTILYAKKVSEISNPTTKIILALATSKLTNHNTSLCPWRTDIESFDRAFKSHRIPMIHDFYESRPFGEGGPTWIGDVKNTISGLKGGKNNVVVEPGVARFGDATDHFLPDDSVDLWATDPPYYDAVPYSDISNYFVTVLQSMLPDIIMENGLAPKIAEVVQDGTELPCGGKKSDQWYEGQVSKSLEEGLRVVKKSGIAYWVYAHKTTKGWSSVLRGIISSGWKVTGSWPIDTEMKSRVRAQNSAALSTSIHIIMRPRDIEAGVGEWSEILNQLPSKLKAWLIRMSNAGVMGADAIYSCIGPAMELFSKYDSVERASGQEIKIDEYLEYVWDTVADEAIKLLSPDSKQSTTEPNARFSLMAIWTLRQSVNVDYISGEKLDEEEIEVAAEPSKLTIPFDTASLLARGIGADIEDLEKNEVIDVKGSNVKILSPEDRRHYLLGVTNVGSKVQQKSSSSIQMKLGESSEEAEARVDVETKHKGLIEMPKRDSQLDKLHQAMLLHADGNSVALEAHLRDNIGDDPAVWQLANTLNTIYLEGSWERSKIEGVIARHQSLR